MSGRAKPGRLIRIFQTELSRGCSGAWACVTWLLADMRFSHALPSQARNKGRISRYLANKCSIASRIDCFSEGSTSAFGTKLREQVEERLAFYDKGAPPTKNIVAMQAAMVSAGMTPGGDKPSKKKKRDAEAGGDDGAAEKKAKKAKKEKSEKKEKKRAVEIDDDDD